MLITLTARTIHGDNGSTLAQLDSYTLRAAAMLGGTCESPETAAEFLRDVYGSVLKTAGAVTLAVGEALVQRSAVA